jgi:putative ABC transport system permease protein
MFRNYLTTAWRNLIRHGLYSFLNVFGLALGMAVSILILLYVAHELSYDRFHSQATRIYRTMARSTYGGNAMQFLHMSAQFGRAVKEANPEVLNYVRMQQPSRAVVQSDPEHRFFEDQLLLADTSLFSVFSFSFLAGNPQTALIRPFTAVITDEMASKYFGPDWRMKNILGKTLRYDTKYQFEITGIVARPPSYSSLDFDFIGSFTSVPTLERGKQQSFSDDDNISYNQSHIGRGAYITYFLLRSEKDATKVESSIPRLVKASGGKVENDEYILEPLVDMHLGSAFDASSRARYIYVFLGIALLILTLALINYISLTTARATKRAKEVGVRKVVGATRSDLIRQFFGESALITGLAFLLALTFVQFMRPVFYDMLQLQIDPDFLYKFQPLLLLLALLLFSSFLAGSYPALLLSGFIPLEVLKGRLSSTQGGALVRRVFTVFQFAVSVGLMICSVVVHQQMHYVRNRNLGLHKDQVMLLPLDATLGKHFQSFKARIREQAGVKSVAAATNSLFRGYAMFFMQTPGTQEDVTINIMSVDQHFFETMDIDWKEKPTDMDQLLYGKNMAVINEAAVQKLKLNQLPKDQPRALGLGADKTNIVGVLKNFHFSSLRYPIDAMLLSVVPDTSSTLSRIRGVLYIRLNPKADLPGTLAAIQRIYEQYQPEKPFEYEFLDDAFNQLYQEEDQLANMFTAFTGFAIFIACLGLFGLVTFTATQRTKEIGIRKVLGAGAGSIVLLLSKDFMRLVLIALAVAIPIAWWIMHRWLEDFAYRIDLRWEAFALVGLAALVMTWGTIGFQTWKAARQNPVKALRYE